MNWSRTWRDFHDRRQIIRQPVTLALIHRNDFTRNHDPFLMFKLLLTFLVLALAPVHGGAAPRVRVLRAIAVPGDPHQVAPLPGGNLLVTCGDGHKVVWKLTQNDPPGNPLRLMAGCQRSPNGNTVFCNYLGHGHIGEQPLAFEITRDKKIVWQFEEHAKFKTINQIFVLDIAGDALR